MGWDILELFSHYLTDAQRLSKSEREEVYEIVVNAIRRTRTLISQTRKAEKDEPSHILSMTWQSAANKLRKLGDERLQSFAETLEHKSKYWSEPHSYTPDQISKYGMLLSQVETKLTELTQ